MSTDTFEGELRSLLHDTADAEGPAYVDVDPTPWSPRVAGSSAAAGWPRAAASPRPPSSSGRRLGRARRRAAGVRRSPCRRPGTTAARPTSSPPRSRPRGTRARPRCPCASTGVRSRSRRPTPVRRATKGLGVTMGRSLGRAGRSGRASPPTQARRRRGRAGGRPACSCAVAGDGGAGPPRRTPDQRPAYKAFARDVGGRRAEAALTGLARAAAGASSALTARSCHRAAVRGGRTVYVDATGRDDGYLTSARQRPDDRLSAASPGNRPARRCCCRGEAGKPTVTAFALVPPTPSRGHRGPGRDGADPVTKDERPHSGGSGVAASLTARAADASPRRSPR